MTQADFERAYGRTKARLRLMLTITLALAVIFAPLLFAVLLAQQGHSRWAIACGITSFVGWLVVVTSDTERPAWRRTLKQPRTDEPSKPC